MPSTLHTPVDTIVEPPEHDPIPVGPVTEPPEPVPEPMVPDPGRPDGPTVIPPKQPEPH